MRIHFPVAVLILASLTVPLQGAPKEKTPQLHPPLQEMLTWLPVDSETLIVINGYFTIPEPSRYTRFTFQKNMDALVAGTVAGLHDDLLRDLLNDQPIQFAVEGSRNFRSPQGLGLMPYEGCQVLRFHKNARPALEKSMALCLKEAHKTLKLQGHDVAMFKERGEALDWSYFVARPATDILLCATNRGYLEEVLLRMGKKNQDRAFPESLPEWQHVNVKADAWAIRHYRKENAEKDPSSPLGPDAPANEPDAKAVGFVFWYDAEKKVATSRYLSTAKNALQLSQNGWHHPHEKLVPRIKQIQPGVIEISLTVWKTTEGSQIYILVLMGYLGHGVYL